MAKGLSGFFNETTEKRITPDNPSGRYSINTSPDVLSDVTTMALGEEGSGNSYIISRGIGETAQPWPAQTDQPILVEGGIGPGQYTSMALGEEGNPPVDTGVVQGLPEISPEALEEIARQLGGSPTRSIGENGSPQNLGEMVTKGLNENGAPLDLGDMVTKGLNENGRPMDLDGNDQVSKNMQEHGVTIDALPNVLAPIQDTLTNTQPFSKDQGMDAINQAIRDAEASGGSFGVDQAPQPFSKDQGMDAINQEIKQQEADATMNRVQQIMRRPTSRGPGSGM